MIINENITILYMAKLFQDLKDQIGELVNNYAKRFKVNKINTKKFLKIKPVYAGWI